MWWTRLISQNLTRCNQLGQLRLQSPTNSGLFQSLQNQLVSSLLRALPNPFVLNPNHKIHRLPLQGQVVVLCNIRCQRGHWLRNRLRQARSRNRTDHASDPRRTRVVISSFQRNPNYRCHILQSTSFSISTLLSHGISTWITPTLHDCAGYENKIMYSYYSESL